VKRRLLDLGFQALALLILLLALGSLAALIADVWADGASRLSWAFLTGFPSRRAADAGIYHALTGSIFVILVTGALAVPIGVASAIYLEEYGRRNFLARIIEINITNLAAVPSIIYGLWGIVFLAPVIQPVSGAISDVLGWIPVFKEAPNADRGTVFTAGLVLAIMILPVITAISREIFAQTPITHREGALALGSTKWEMIRMAVLPYGRSGVVSAAMLGLGRALGETVAVMIILSQPNPIAPWDPSIFAGGETFASKIASSAAELDTPAKTGAFIAAGLVLFVVTFIVNSAARLIVARSGPSANRRPRRPKSVASKGATA
jgi:phosphate transport system permease protein